MIENIRAGGDINAGDGGYSLGTQEKYDEFVKGRNQSLSSMRIQEFMKEAGTDTSGKWMGVEHAEKFAELIVRECVGIADEYDGVGSTIVSRIKQHFGVKESQGWVCSKCGIDRTKDVCPKGHTAAITGECPMTAEAQ